MITWWQRWAGFWAEREHPRVLATIRICLGLVLLYDFMQVWWLDLVVPLFGVQEIGGLSDAMARKHPPMVYRWLPGTEGVARSLHATITLAALTFTLGAFTRTSALVLLLAWAQWSMVLPASDRGIDTLCRDVLCILIFSGAGQCWSVDAVRANGRTDDSTWTVPAWPRRLIIVQCVAMYFLAGVQKTGLTWYPMGHSAALYFILQDPAIARFDFTWLARQPWFFLTQVGTVVTIVFQDTYPLVFLWIWFKRTAERGGRLRHFSNRWHLEWWWIGTGALFHIMLAIGLELGIFPFAMLALYPAWLSPDEMKRLMVSLRLR